MYITFACLNTLEVKTPLVAEILTVVKLPEAVIFCSKSIFELGLDYVPIIYYTDISSLHRAVFFCLNLR